jgi:SAM-dependent methyltransferase
MRHPHDAFGSAGDLDFAAAVTAQQAEQRSRLDKAVTTPFRQTAYMLAALYCTALALVAAIVKVWFRPVPGPIERALSEIYHYVPEMALHKTIELHAFMTQPLVGCGLDLGCGDGCVGGVLIRVGRLRELHGVDQNPGCEASVLANGYAGFKVGDVQSLDNYPEGSFDYAISICVVEHVRDLGRTLRGVARVLKPGGRFVFSTPAPRFRDSTLGFRVLASVGRGDQARAFQRAKDASCMHFHYYSADRWRSLLEDAGFETITVTPIFSRAQLLAYDLMNIQVNWMQFYFADKLSRLLQRRGMLRRAMIAATATLSTHLGRTRAALASEDATHLLVSCTKRLA